MQLGLLCSKSPRWRNLQRGEGPSSLDLEDGAECSIGPGCLLCVGCRALANWAMQVWIKLMISSKSPLLPMYISKASNSSGDPHVTIASIRGAAASALRDAQKLSASSIRFVIAWSRAIAQLLLQKSLCVCMNSCTSR